MQMMTLAGCPFFFFSDCVFLAQGDKLWKTVFLSFEDLTMGDQSIPESKGK